MIPKSKKAKIVTATAGTTLSAGTVIWLFAQFPQKADLQDVKKAVDDLKKDQQAVVEVLKQDQQAALDRLKADMNRALDQKQSDIIEARKTLADIQKQISEIYTKVMVLDAVRINSQSAEARKYE